MTFANLGLHDALTKAVADAGYETATEVQMKAIPVALTGRDLMVSSSTGSGKTASFILPAIQRILTARADSTQKRDRATVYGPRILVLTPTRELAMQVAKAATIYGRHVQGLRVATVVGGVPYAAQIKALRGPLDILISTPGRLLDHLQTGKAVLDHVELLVLDEADRMLDMGFIHDVKKVLAVVPKNKQSLLFSATFSDEIRDLASGLLHDPLHIQVTPRNTTVQRITQVIHPVGRGKKKALLAHIIKERNWSQVLVFTRTKFGANNVAEFLEKNGISAMALHGNKSQGARTQALAGFKSGDVRALVATDIAARGIDIDELPHVVNYEIPNVSEDYVHRIGRTGRAGNSGEAVNLVCLDEEGFMQDIERFTKQQIPVQQVEGFGPEPGEKAEPLAMGRQTIWGGIGKPPSRDVMQAAAKAARTEMMARVRDNKANQGGRGGNGGGGGRSQGARPAQNAGRAQQPSLQDQPPRGYQNDGQPPRQPRHNGGGYGDHPNRGQGRHAGGGNGGPSGQPDPLRTSIDSMAERGRRGGGGGGRPNRSGGGGFGPRGPGNPTRSFGR